MMLPIISFFLFLFVLAQAASRTSAPSGALVVSKSATSKQYSTIQKAINALSVSSKTTQSIFISPGVYNEQVTIPSLAGGLVIYGYTEDTSTYADNQVNITHGIGLDTASSDDATGTVRAETENLKMYNVNMINTHGQGSQALAVSANVGVSRVHALYRSSNRLTSVQNQGYYACQFHGYQDTILAEQGAQVYASSLIVGSADFIFGQRASAWFHKCDIRVLTASLGYITASGRSSDDSSYYVLDHCSIAALAGEAVAAGAYYLGRPWEDYARVVVQYTSMTNVINSKGWSQWSSSSPNTDHVSFEEYDNTGAGASGTRASFATKSTTAVTIETVLGSDYASQSWVDTSYL